ncbi:MAG: sigma-70 family RNA polymerase sigma factor [Acidobacteria bacterium]|nr:sigma-70 family RNA polymerase sigma factor [Acidobacteriota bacterium]
MATPSSHEVTQLLHAWSDGNAAALAELAPLVEKELRRLARRSLARDQAAQSLAPSDLVNEAYVRLIDWKTARWENRAHFFGVAAQLMRRILVDHARHRQAEKHGGDIFRISLSGAENESAGNDPALLALDDALTALAAFDQRKCTIVELKFFAGLNENEIAEVMKLALRTVQREWNFARAWLYHELNQT